jgi:hypothetical protein
MAREWSRNRFDESQRCYSVVRLTIVQYNNVSSGGIELFAGARSDRPIVAIMN